jgi:hypothetical protein
MAKKKVEDKEVCTLTVLSENKNPNVNKLKEIYEKDKRKAKVIFDNNKNTHSYSESRLCLFEYPNGDFRIVSLIRKYGMSINAIIYSRESNNWAISYKHKTKSFYFIDGMKRVRVLSLNILQGYCDKSNSIIYDYLVVKFGWLRNILESKHAGWLSFATIIKNKLYNDREILKYIYKCPYPVAKMLSENHAPYTAWDFAKIWKEVKKVLINIENLKPEFLKSHYFMDTTKMASSLGYKVNCSWGLKRLKQEHDRYSKEIVDTILEFEDIIDLRIKKVYLDFAEFSGIEILTTNHQLVYEGRVMSHCVGTYSPQVNSGSCAIYRYKGHTLDLRFRKSYVVKTSDEETKTKLEINQFMGYDNAYAPKELKEEVQAMVDQFNMNLIDYTTEDDIAWYESANHDNDLPF